MKFPILASCIMLVLTACGFEPMYGSEPSAPLAMGAIAVEPIAGGRPGDQLRSSLEDLLNPEAVPTANAPYRLAISIGQTQVPVSVEPDGRILRFNLVLASNFRLVRASDGQEVYGGSVERVTAYNVSETNDFSTTIAERDALKRTIRELAEDYRLKLAAWMAQHPVAL